MNGMTKKNLGFMCNSQQLLSLPQIFIIAHFILDVSRSVILFMMMQ